MVAEIYRQVSCEPNIGDGANTLGARDMMVAELAIGSSDVHFKTVTGYITYMVET